jgi:hypothetical protein
MVRRVLDEHFRMSGKAVDVSVSHGYRENIHIMVIAPHFELLTMPQRYDEVWPLIEALPPDTVQRVSLCVLLTPEEHRAAYGEPLAAA